MMRRAALCLSLLVTGCGSWSPLHWITPYTVDIQQGNMIDADKLARVKTGMTRNEIKALLGTPLLTDAFHPDRWDYVYRMRKGGNIVEQRRLARLDGNVPLPADPPAAQESTQ